MRRSGLFISLMTPSLLSAVLCGGVAAVMLLLGAWSYLTARHVLYDNILSEHLFTAIVQGVSIIPHTVAPVFENPLFYNAFVIFGSILVGIAFYFLLMGFHRLYRRATNTWHTILHADPVIRRVLESEFWVKAGVRLLVVLAWILYWLVFTEAVIPFGMNALYISLDDMHVLQKWLYTASGFFVLILGWHGHVIFIRLLSLRPRLFSSPDTR